MSMLGLDVGKMPFSLHVPPVRNPVWLRLRQTIQSIQALLRLIYMCFARKSFSSLEARPPSQLVHAYGKVQEVDGPMLVGGARFRAATHSLYQMS